jgi:hypothetical protein
VNASGFGITQPAKSSVTITSRAYLAGTSTAGVYRAHPPLKRQQRPDILLYTSTNGLALNAKKIEALAAGLPIDSILFSIDGAWQDSYRRYHVNGNLERALGNMAAPVRACERAGSANRVQIIWQYILFEWNDSEAELDEARRRAADNRCHAGRGHRPKRA